MKTKNQKPEFAKPEIHNSYCGQYRRIYHADRLPFGYQNYPIVSYEITTDKIHTLNKEIATMDFTSKKEGGSIVWKCQPRLCGISVNNFESIAAIGNVQNLISRDMVQFCHYLQSGILTMHAEQNIRARDYERENAKIEKEKFLAENPAVGDDIAKRVIYAAENAARDLNEQTKAKYWESPRIYIETVNRDFFSFCRNKVLSVSLINGRLYWNKYSVYSGIDWENRERISKKDAFSMISKSLASGLSVSAHAPAYNAEDETVSHLVSPHVFANFAGPDEKIKERSRIGLVSDHSKPIVFKMYE